MVKWLEFIRNIKFAYKLYFDTKRRDAELFDLFSAFLSYDFSYTVIGGCKVCFSPFRYVGICVQLIHNYGIELHKGLSSSDCRAVLPKSKWQYSINKDVCSFKYGTFMEMNPGEVQDIVGFGKTINEAVCKCLINAKIAGVI